MHHSNWTRKHKRISDVFVKAMIPAGAAGWNNFGAPFASIFIFQQHEILFFSNTNSSFPRKDYWYGIVVIWVWEQEYHMLFFDNLYCRLMNTCIFFIFVVRSFLYRVFLFRFFFYWGENKSPLYFYHILSQ